MCLTVLPLDHDHKIDHKNQVMEAFVKAEKRQKPNVRHMFEEVYDQIPDNLSRQWEDLKKHVDKYPQHYPIKSFDGIN